MPWWFEVIERKHELQNPTSVDKIKLLGAHMNLRTGSRVLDVASGRGGPALVLARTFGCHVTCVELHHAFADAARARAEDAGLAALVEVFTADAKDFVPTVHDHDAVLCLGASFIWGGLSESVTALMPTVRRDGLVAIGEPYWRQWPLPKGVEAEEGWDFVALADTVARFERAGIELVALIASSEDDWDRYESLHWLALEEWLHENPGDPEADRFRDMGRRYRDQYLRWQRDLLGWAIFVGRRR